VKLNSSIGGVSGWHQTLLKRRIAWYTIHNMPQKRAKVSGVSGIKEGEISFFLTFYRGFLRFRVLKYRKGLTLCSDYASASRFLSFYDKFPFVYFKKNLQSKRRKTNR